MVWAVGYSHGICTVSMQIDTLYCTVLYGQQSTRYTVYRLYRLYRGYRVYRVYRLSVQHTVLVSSVLWTHLAMAVVEHCECGRLP